MNVLRRFIRPTVNITKNISIKQVSSGGLYEPDYLAGMAPKIPLYDEININLRGYDYPTLETYQKYIHNLLKNIEINVEECWATPAQDLQITTYKPLSEIINSQYKLKVYQRTVQITDVSSVQLPIIIRILEASAPSGVTVEVLPHEEYHENIRYVPDNELLTLKQELDELGGPSKKK